jgi:hypothetical protein
MKRLILVFLIPLLLVACGPTEANLVPYTSPNYPVTFQMPEGWAITDNEDSITIASEEALLLARAVTNGARINISITPSQFTGSANATEVIETAVRSFRNQADTEVIQEVESVIINTQSAVQTVLRGPDTQRNEIILRYVIIENLTVNQTAVVAAVHDANLNNEYGPLMADIVNSIELGQEP